MISFCAFVCTLLVLLKGQSDLVLYCLPDLFIPILGMFNCNLLTYIILFYGVLINHFSRDVDNYYAFYFTSCRHDVVWLQYCSLMMERVDYV